jgi:sulfur-carrier protein
MDITIRIPGPLRSLADGEDEVRVRGATVGDALDSLIRRHPALARHLRADSGEIREHVNVFVNQDDIRSANGQATTLAPGDAITVVPSIAGG